MQGAEHIASRMTGAHGRCDAVRQEAPLLPPQPRPVIPGSVLRASDPHQSPHIRARRRLHLSSSTTHCPCPAVALLSPLQLQTQDGIDAKVPSDQGQPQHWWFGCVVVMVCSRLFVQLLRSAPSLSTACWLVKASSRPRPQRPRMIVLALVALHAAPARAGAVFSSPSWTVLAGAFFATMPRAGSHHASLRAHEYRRLFRAFLALICARNSARPFT